MSLKIENSRRVAKSRPVCMDLKSKAVKHVTKILGRVDCTILYKGCWRSKVKKMLEDRDPAILSLTEEYHNTD